jgi:hypothetical protein
VPAAERAWSTLRQYLLRAAILQAEQAWLGLDGNEAAVQALVVEGTETGSEATGPVRFDPLTPSLQRLVRILILIFCIFLSLIRFLTVHELLQAGCKPCSGRREHRWVVLVFLEILDLLDLVIAMPVELQFSGRHRATFHLLFHHHGHPDAQVVK